MAPTKQKRVQGLAKDSIRYWRQKLRRQRYGSKAAGTFKELPAFYVRIRHQGQEHAFTFNTLEQSVAATRARDTYVRILQEGWDSVLRERNGVAPPKATPTIGDLLASIAEKKLLEAGTLQNYANCLLTIASEVFEVDGGRQRFNARGDGNRLWREKVEAIRLIALTPEKLDEWRIMRLHSCAATPERQKSGKRTINSYLRCARSLFAKRIQEALTEITWPDPIPFASVRFERGVKPPRYQSKIDPSAIIAAANKELRPEHPELYKIFLLALTAGLRKGEIDWLEWNAFDWSKGLIRLANTAFLQLKTEESQGEVPLDPEVMAVFRNYFSAAQGRFVVDAGRRRLPKPSQKTYRCEKLFRRLNDWLRSQGISANKPLHELRKELGALVASNHGIYAAKEILRHANIGTTVAHYADQKNRVSVGLGSILEGSDGETDERNP